MCCGFFQSVLKYNVADTDPSDALNITVKSKPKPSQRKCLKHIIGKLTAFPGQWLSHKNYTCATLIHGTHIRK